MRYALLAVEGYHDQAAIGKLLELASMKNFNGKRNDLDSFWDQFIPNYPPPSQNLYARMDMPSIYQTGELSVAIYQGGGDDLVEDLPATLDNHEPYRQEIDAFGIIIDADKSLPATRAAQLAQIFRAFFPAFPTEPGNIAQGQPRTGLYVLP